MNARRTGLPIFLVLTCFAIARPAFAQEKKEEPPRWKGDVSLGLSLARGNTESMTLSFTFSAGGPVGKNLTWKNNGLYLLSEVDEATTGEALEIDSRLDWKHTPRFYSYLELQALRDRFKNYSYRLLPDAGVGYKVVDQASVRLEFEAGLSEVFTRYYDSGETSSYTGLRGGEGLAWKISDSAEFNERAAITSDVSDLGRYYLRLEANLLTAITGSWSVKLSFIDSYDSRPVGPGIKSNDVVLVAAISRKF